jgi:glycosyltransferase involved in cell wall biosynthesis
VAQHRRIGHFIETELAGGAEQVMVDLARFTKAQSEIFSPVVLHFGHPWIAQQCERHQIDQLIVPFRHTFKSTLRLPAFAFQFSRWLKAHKIELLHSHLFGPVTGAAPASFLAGIPHVGTLHDVYMIEEKPSRMLLVKMAILLGTQLVTVSKDMQRFYSGRMRFGGSRIQTIYNGIDSGELTPVGSVADEVADLEKDKEFVTIACVGRLIPLKRVDLVVKAVQTLSAEYPVRLLIIGEGPEEALLEQLAGQDLNRSIFLLGARDDVPQWLRKSDIFVQFSSTEGLSRSILEAIALGLPAVVSDVGGNREIVLHKENGFVVSPTDSQQLMAALRVLIQDGEMRSRFGARSREHAQTEFSRKSNNQLYLNLYEKLVG